MKVVIQRSKKSSVSVESLIVGSIDHGLVVLVGFTNGDTVKDIEYIINKLINLRIFNDEAGLMNKSLIDVKGNILSISQFTLYANTLKGRRPSYTDALNPIEAEPLYNLFNEMLRENNINVETGIFGAEMEVQITNDGPVTIVMES
ncbi:MAG: D-aminoacyl-tRNA deacylase [Bacilli bacterium]|nr:D-aminoacyl-tRNA deacylase [Bacilli bacterium]MDD4282805.1 D-aminoacyl-tRNA deacylase [Bacilli bacterium]MDD4718880.1 D-aminoacyl-tRNA deacylase [Bacilli bacterium]